MLSGLDLEGQLTLAGVCKRSYQATVPWNICSYKLPKKASIMSSDIESVVDLRSPIFFLRKTMEKSITRMGKSRELNARKLANFGAL